MLKLSSHIIFKIPRKTKHRRSLRTQTTCDENTQAYNIRQLMCARVILWKLHLWELQILISVDYIYEGYKLLFYVWKLMRKLGICCTDFFLHVNVLSPQWLVYIWVAASRSSLSRSLSHIPPLEQSPLPADKVVHIHPSRQPRWVFCWPTGFNRMLLL